MDYYNHTNTPEQNDYIGVVLPKNAYYGGNFKVKHYNKTVKEL